MSDCIHCNNSEYKRKYGDLEKTKQKAKEWATANEYTGTLVIIQNPSARSFGFRKPDCECLIGTNALTEVDRIYVN